MSTKELTTKVRERPRVHIKGGHAQSEGSHKGQRFFSTGKRCPTAEGRVSGWNVGERGKSRLLIEGATQKHKGSTKSDFRGGRAGVCRRRDRLLN